MRRRRAAPRARDRSPAARHDQRRLEANDALLVERPRRGHAVLEHLGDDPTAVSFVRQLDADQAARARALRARPPGYSAAIVARAAQQLLAAHASPFAPAVSSSRTSIAASAAAQASSLPPNVDVCSERRVAERAIPHVRPRDERADRNDAAGESLGQRHHVGHDAVAIARKAISAAPQIRSAPRRQRRALRFDRTPRARPADSPAAAR